MPKNIPRASLAGDSAAQSGFSLIEVMISMVILTVGLVSLLGVFGLAMASTQTSQKEMIAKQLANESYESIITARNTTQIGWDDIQNQGSTSCVVTGAPTCGIFLANMQPIYKPGATEFTERATTRPPAHRRFRIPGRMASS